MKKIIFLLLVTFFTSQMNCTFFMDQHIYYEAVRRVEKLFAILRAAANADYIGEDVSQLQHALQCAHQALLHGGSPEFIIACLFHDIGHQLPGESMGGYGNHKHEETGAIFIQQHGFSKTIVELIRAHIDAKRYFIYKDPVYFDQLSFGSQKSFEYQGDPMTAQEAAAFEQDPLFEEKLKLRMCEERAKEPNCIVPELDTYFQMVVYHLYHQLMAQTENS